LLFFFKKRLTNRTLFAAIPMNDRNRTRHSANCFSDFYSCKKTRITSLQRPAVHTTMEKRRGAVAPPMTF